MKKILVPTDFSKQSYYALDFAYDVACKTGGEIILMHVVEYPSTSIFAAAGEVVTSEPSLDHEVEIMEEAKSELEKILSNPGYQDVSIRHIEKTGNPFNSISKMISQEEADLVVMGTSGATALEEWFVGSNTEKVVRMANCPVISLPAPARCGDIHRIVFSTNFDHNDKVIQKLKEWCKLCNAELHIVRINTPYTAESSAYLMQQLRQFAKTHDLENYHLHTHNSVTVESGIFDFMQEVNADMIALATHGRRGIFHLFTGSIAENVVNHTLKPVWTYSLKA